MAPRSNNLMSVFQHVNMLTGPIYKDPETGEESRCWPFTLQSNNEGRPYISIDGKKYIAYRLVWELVNGEPLGKRLFRHKCDNSICCNPKHGIAGTHQENMNDMKERERHGLPHVTVKAIRNLLKLGVLTHAQIAANFGIARSTVTEINNNTNYGHVKDD